MNAQRIGSEGPVCVDGCAAGFTPRRAAVESAKFRAGGIGAALVTVASIETREMAMDALSEWWRADKRQNTGVRVASSVTELRKIVDGGDLAAVLHFQGTAPLGSDIEMVDTFHRLGVRVMQPTYNYAGLVGDGCLEERNAGLTHFGRRVISRMQQIGIAVDLSHAGNRTCLDVLGITEAPVIASHANARSICDNPRNLTNEVIDGIARSGGVIGLCAFPSFVSPDKPPTLDQLIDHAVYIADRVGAEHISLGTDFIDEDESDFEYYGYDERYYPRPPWTWPSGFSWWDEVGNLRPALHLRGFSQDEADGILGENLLRSLDNIWSTHALPS